MSQVNNLANDVFKTIILFMNKYEHNLATQMIRSDQAALRLRALLLLLP